jgi:hypothetical protein
MRTLRFFLLFSLPSRLKCFHAVLSYTVVSPSPPPRLARLIRKRRRGGVERYLLPSATFFPAGVYTGPNAPETNRFARHRLYYNICTMYLYVYGYGILYRTIYIQQQLTSHSLFFFNNPVNQNCIFRIFKYYIIIFSRTSYG